jgi:hypothetical protein
MAPQPEARLRKIRRASAFVRVICDVLLALVVLIGIGSVVDLVSGIGGINLPSWYFSTASLTFAHRLILAAVTVAAWGILFKGIFHLRRLFGDFTRGEVFTRHAVRQLRWFGIACVLWSVMKIVWVASLALASHPMRTFPANADGLGAGIVIIAIAWFMDMAVDLKEENELTV